MKAQIFAGILLVGATNALYAEDSATADQVVAPEAAPTAVETAPAGVQSKTFGAGSQMLIDISEQVGSDLDAMLEQEIGGEVTVRVQSHELLVSNN